nr:hypothetical protein CFP56_33403 [Quercus suber]
MSKLVMLLTYPAMVKCGRSNVFHIQEKQVWANDQKVCSENHRTAAVAPAESRLSIVAFGRAVLSSTRGSTATYVTPRGYSNNVGLNSRMQSHVDVRGTQTSIVPCHLSSAKSYRIFSSIAIQSAPVEDAFSGPELTDSPLFQCRSNGTPTPDTSSPYCIVHGGATRIAACCSGQSDSLSQVHFLPDCYLWCNVDLVPYSGLDSLVQTHRKFAACLELGQDAAYVPDLFCGNATSDEEPRPSTSSRPSSFEPCKSQSSLPTEISSTDVTRSIGK